MNSNELENLLKFIFKCTKVWIHYLFKLSVLSAAGNSNTGRAHLISTDSPLKPQGQCCVPLKHPRGVSFPQRNKGQQPIPHMGSRDADPGTLTQPHLPGLSGPTGRARGSPLTEDPDATQVQAQVREETGISQGRTPSPTRRKRVDMAGSSPAGREVPSV